MGKDTRAEAVILYVNAWASRDVRKMLRTRLAHRRGSGIQNGIERITDGTPSRDPGTTWHRGTSSNWRV